MSSSRSLEARRHHYEVERELAGRLRQSNRAERTALFGKMYDELFARVPDHPRLTRKGSEEARARGVRAQMRLLSCVLKPGQTLVEFASGDGWLSNAAAATAKEVISVDISDQRDVSQPPPTNVRHVIYDGYHLELPEASADIVFSYQFLEHLHPEDVPLHFQMVRRLLKPGGKYVFDTPHRYSGPHDISREFSATLDCFHFQEWTHREMRRTLRKNGFDPAWVVRFGKSWEGWLPNRLVDLVEFLLLPVPQKLRVKLCARLFPSVALVAVRSSSD